MLATYSKQMNKYKSWNTPWYEYSMILWYYFYYIVTKTRLEDSDF